MKSIERADGTIMVTSPDKTKVNVIEYHLPVKDCNNLDDDQEEDEDDLNSERQQYVQSPSLRKKYEDSIQE